MGAVQHGRRGGSPNARQNFQGGRRSRGPAIKPAESLCGDHARVIQTNHQDRREHPRAAAVARARVFYGQQMAHWADCTIVDLSKGGARLQISAIYPLPSRFVVLRLADGVVYDVRVRWRRGDMTGVAFDASTQLEDNQEDRLAAVRQAWSALRAFA